MSIYTRRGDDGTTGLADGSRTSKASTRVEAYGAVDEANAAVGVARAITDDTEVAAVLTFLQHKLMNCSSSLASPNSTDRTPVISAADVQALEAAIDRFSGRAPELRSFIVGTGDECAERLQFARAVMRRAERRVVALAASGPVAQGVPEFINRASDVLFAAARMMSAANGVPEESWDPTLEPPSFE